MAAWVLLSVPKFSWLLLCVCVLGVVGRYLDAVGSKRFHPPPKESKQRFISRTFILNPKCARAQVKSNETTCKM